MARKKSSYPYRYVQTKKQYSGLPDIALCDECTLLGYCKKYTPAHIQESIEIVTSVLVNPSFDLTYYTAKIPLRVNSKESLNQYAKKHLQTAYDAFHQDDFETALLHFKSVEPSGAYYCQSNYFLTVTYFWLDNYEMADAHMQACIDHIFNGVEDFTLFLDECSKHSVPATIVEERSICAKELFCTNN